MKRFKILLACVVIVIVGWTAAWLYGASILRKTINDQMVASAGAVSCGQENIGGYPFRLFFDCKNANLTDGDLSYTLARFKASVVVTQPKLVVGFLQSPMEITDAFSGAHYFIHWDEAKMSLRHDLVQLLDGRLELNQMRLNDTGGTGADRMSAKTVRLYLQSRETIDTVDDQNYALFAAMDAFNVPGADIANGTAQIDLFASHLPPIDGRALPSDFARIWQKNGGALTLNDISVKIDTAQLNGKGNFSLDGQGLLNGMSEVTLVNFNSYLAATPLGPIAGSLLGNNAAGQDTQQMVISVRGGLVLLGPLPLMQLNPLF